MPNTWKGIEVEGRLSGKLTLFVGGPGNFNGYEHVYFNPWYINEYGYGEILKLLGRTLVSVCVTPEMLRDVPEPVLQQAHIVVAIPCPVDLTEYLKRDDEIRLDHEQYFNSISQWKTFTQAKPEDYRYDVTVE